MAIPALNMSRELTIRGFSGLKDVAVVSFGVSGVTADGGLNLDIVARMHNPSTASAKLGFVKLWVMWKASVIGHVLADVNIAAGDNLVHMSGTLLPEGDAAKKDLGGFLAAYLRGDKDARATAQGVECAEACAPWVAELVKHVRLDVPLPPAPGDLISGVGLPEVTLDFDASGTPRLSGTVTAGYTLPFDNVPVTISRVGLTMSLMYQDKPFSTAVIPFQPCASDMHTHTVFVLVSAVKLTVTDVDVRPHPMHPVPSICEHLCPYGIDAWDCATVWILCTCARCFVQSDACYGSCFILKFLTWNMNFTAKNTW